MQAHADVSILYHRKDELWVDWIIYQLKSRGLIVAKFDFSKGKIKSVPLWLHENSSEVTATIVIESEEMFASGTAVAEWKQAMDVYGNRQIAAYRRKGLMAPPLGAMHSSNFIGDSEGAGNEAMAEFCARMRFRNMNRDKLIAENSGTPPIYPGYVPRNWKMPYNDVVNFVGRTTEISNIEKLLRKNSAINVRSKVTGRGFGLTSTMAKLVYQNIANYSSIWWLTAFDEAQLFEGLKELGQRFGVQGLSGGFLEMFPKIHAAMQGKAKLPYLLILERPTSTTMQAIEKLFENTKLSGGVVVCLDGNQRKEVIEEFHLDSMAREDVLEIMNLAVPSGAANVLEDIVEFLKFHPLLVTIAAGLLKNGRNPKTFIEDFQLEGQLVTVEKGFLKPFAILSRFVIDQLSFSNPDVEQLLTFSAYFAPQPIPSCIFERPENTDLKEDLFTRIIYDSRRLSAGLGKLSQYGLINLSGSTFVMHPLISESITSMREYRKNWPERITQILSERLSDDVPADLLEERRAQIYPHMVDICTNLIRSGAVNDEVVVLINNIANQAKVLQNWDLATELLLGLRNYFVKTFGEKNENVANVSASLGVIYKLQNNIHDAKLMFDSSLKIDIDIYGSANVNVADDYCQLARIYELENNIVDAVSYFRKASDILRVSLGGEHPKYAKVLGELIGVMKKNKQTIEIYDIAKTVVLIEKKTYGNDSPKIVHSMVNVGFAAVEKELFSEALENFQAGMAIEAKVYGLTHIRIGKMLVLIGGVYERMGDKAQAKDKYNQALPIFTAALGDAHLSVVAVKACLKRVS